ncbi:MAG TPA: branched-chain amino acid ABC transporter permease [Rhizobiales bacterium]|nr:branched-chain amino acid ABC transporter permease [Hyphomicrobiales bacterium]
MLDNIIILFEAPLLTLDMVINGLLIGAIFALMAYGLALVWGVMNVKNLAQGDFVILGAYVTWWLYQAGISPFFGIVASAAVLWLLAGGLYMFDFARLVKPLTGKTGNAIPLLVLMVAGGLLAMAVSGPGKHSVTPVVPDSFFIGILVVLLAVFVIFGGIYGFVVRHVIERDLFTSLLATFGVAIVMEQSMNLIFGADEQTVSLDLDSFSFLNNMVTIQPVRLIAFVAALLLAVVVITFMKRSRMGQAIRATAQNARAARVMGIDTEKVYAFTFALNAAICGAAGALVALIWEFQPFIGLIFSIRSFVIVTAAGLGNLPAVIAAGLGMGVLEQTGAFIFGTQFQQAIVVGMLIVVLVVKLFFASRRRQVIDQ